MKTYKSLWERCNISSNTKEDSFVGVKVDKDDITINFPIGFNCKKAEDKIIRKDIILLLLIIKKFNNSTQIEYNKNKGRNNDLEFPIQSFQYLIVDYLKNGIYFETEDDFISTNSGKVNWKRTIQKKHPYIIDNNILYLDFIAKKNINRLDSLLTRIHEFCVYESFLKLGWLYSEVKPNKPKISLNKKLFIYVLNEAIDNTFLDSKKQLFTAMFNIINYNYEQSSKSIDFSMGTYRFEYVWERMIDYVYGEDNKNIYFPRARWTLKDEIDSFESSVLQPDTIIKIKNVIYIIDAKYYKYGETKCKKDLPSSSSIQKQITYGEYLSNENSQVKTGRTEPFSEIYNAFLMPYNKAKHNNENYKVIGIANADWKNSLKKYENVVGILIDIKYLMNKCYKNNEEEINIISNIISSELI